MMITKVINNGELQVVPFVQRAGPDIKITLNLQLSLGAIAQRHTLQNQRDSYESIRDNNTDLCSHVIG